MYIKIVKEGDAMRLTNADVLVIGGGVAGCMAARSAAQKGKKVILLAKNGGETELSSGVVDILGKLRESSDYICNYESAMKNLALENPEHPYVKQKDQLKESEKCMLELLKDGDYPLYGDGKNNDLVPNYLGTFTPVAYLPEHLKDAKRTDDVRNIMVFDFKGNGCFNAEYAANSYSQVEAANGYIKNHYYSCSIELDEFKGKNRLSNAEIADFLDTEKGRKQFVDQVKHLISSVIEIDLLLFAPVLGIYKTNLLIETLREQTKKKVAEVLSYGTSISGFRLSRALYKGLEKSGVIILRGFKAQSIAQSGEEVLIRASAGVRDQLHDPNEVEYRCKSLVIATGGYIGGGIKAKQRDIWVDLLEDDLGLIPEKDVNPEVFSNDDAGFLSYGIKVDDNMRVLSRSDDNFFACGEILSGFNSVYERSGCGVAMVTGYVAGKKAAEAIG